MKVRYLWEGPPGHPVHPPLTDATLGAYTFAAIAAVLSALGVAAEELATAWWLALVVALALSAPTALTGLADWLKLTRGTPLWRTATAHLVTMLTATAIFLVAAIAGHGDYQERELGGLALALTLAGFAALTLGGWLGGTITYVHGMRVLQLPEEPAGAAVSPRPEPEEEAAEGS